MRTVEPNALESDWADQTRRVLTRDLLLRAARSQPAEGHALQFRALHLNLPLVGVVADQLALSPSQRSLVEHDALDALVEALRLFDPYGDQGFADYAVPFVERAMATHLRATSPATGGPGPSGRRDADVTRSQLAFRLVARRVAVVIAGRV